MSEPIEPALTPEEWVQFGRVHLINSSRRVSVREAADMNDFHGAAARALYDEDFGFTHRHVRLLRAIIYETSSDYHEEIASLTAIIAALLPPQTGEQP